MTTVYSNSFTGSNGAAWPDFTSSEGTNDIQTNKGRQLTAASAFARAKAFYNVPDIPQDFIFTVDVVLQTVTGTDFYIEAAVRGSSDSFNNQWIHSSWQWQYFGTDGPSLYRVNNVGTATWLAGTPTPSAAQGDTLHLKIAPLAGVFRIKAWKNAESEPDYTTYDDTASAPNGTRIMLGVINGNDASATDLRWDDVLIDDGETPTISTPTPRLLLR